MFKKVHWVPKEYCVCLLLCLFVVLMFPLGAVCSYYEVSRLIINHHVSFHTQVLILPCRKFRKNSRNRNLSYFKKYIAPMLVTPLFVWTRTYTGITCQSRITAQGFKHSLNSARTQNVARTIYTWKALESYKWFKSPSLREECTWTEGSWPRYSISSP